MASAAIVARDYMHTQPETILEDQTVWSALAIMRDRNIRHLFVIRDGRFVGVVSNRDFRRILERLRPDGSIQGLRSLTVAEIMTPVDEVITSRPETPLRDIAELLIQRRVGCIPIVEGDNVLGILTPTDVIAALLNFHL